MRYLLENEAKAVVATAGIPVPRAWPEGMVPAAERGPFVVKVLVEEGRRGLRGGVQEVNKRADLEDVTQRMLSNWPGPRPSGIHTEEQITDLVAELYIGVVADRDRAVPLLLLGPGGVEVEATGVEHIPMSPVRPWQANVERRIRQVLSLEAPSVEPAPVVEVARRLVNLYYDQGAHMLEINPLGVRSSGDVVALDARVILPGPPLTQRRSNDGLSGVARQLGVNVVDGGGDLAVITSGAGLLMATVDLLGDRGAHLGPLIDLGGLVFGDAEEVTPLLQAVVARRPRRILISYFLQLASCAVLAKRIVAALDGSDVEVVVRQRGVDAAEARELLESAGCLVVEDLMQACEFAVPTVPWGGVAWRS